MSTTSHIAARAPLEWRKTGRFCAAAFLVDFAGGVYFAAQPFFAMRLGADSWHLGLMGLIWGATYAVTTVLAGWLSDHVNRKRQIIISATLTAAVVLGTAFVQTLEQFYAIVFLHALVLAFHWPPFFGWIGEAHFKSQLGRATAAFNVSWGAGEMLGGAAGGLLFALSYRLPFFVGVAPLLIAAGVIGTLPWHASRIAEEARPAGEARETPKRILAAVWVSTFAAFVVTGLMAVVFPRLGEVQLGIDSRLFGSLLAVRGLARTAVFVVGIWFGRQLCGMRVTAAVHILVAACVAGVAFAGSPAWIALTMVVAGLCMGQNYFRGLYTSLEGASGGGLKSAIHEGMLFAGHVLGSTGGGLLILLTGDLRAPYVPMGGLVLALLVVQVFLVASARRRYGGWTAFSEGHPAPPPASGSAGS